MSVEQNKAIALHFAKDGWGNIPGWDQVWNELVAEDFVWHFCNQDIRGFKACQEFYSSLYQGFPDIQLLSVESLIAEDDKVAFRSTFKGNSTLR